MFKKIFLLSLLILGLFFVSYATNHDLISNISSNHNIDTNHILNHNNDLNHESDALTNERKFVKMNVAEITCAKCDSAHVKGYTLNFADGTSTTQLNNHDYYENKDKKDCQGDKYDLLSKGQNAGFYKFYIPKEYANNIVNNITLVWNVERVSISSSNDYKYPQTTLNVVDNVVEDGQRLDIKHEYKVGSLDHVKAVINGKTIWSYGY
jgi:hypothetical protein